MTSRGTRVTIAEIAVAAGINKAGSGLSLDFP